MYKESQHFSVTGNDKVKNRKKMGQCPCDDQDVPNEMVIWEFDDLKKQDPY